MNVAITAGPTREYIDPIRFLSNVSSGKMGYALAKIISEKQHSVHLISGPVSLAPLTTCVMTFVETAKEMLKAVLTILPQVDVLIMSAAVSDYTLEKKNYKIKKSEKTKTLTLFKTADILVEVSKIPHKAFVVGFSAESENSLKNASVKLKEKKLDMIVANPIQSHTGFSSDDNEGFLLFAKKQNRSLKIEKCSKIDFAQKIFKAICNEIS